MSFIRPATPGFLVTLVATILLAVVTFSVPYIKSVFFLKASLSQEGLSGFITFGTLGYCTDLSDGISCSKPSIGYQLDINALVGNKLPIEIPNVLVKWLTYALFLHVIALILAAISAVFGLLAHVREVSMACCSTCVSGFAAAVALLAFIFDIALFFITKSRINSIQGASASIGIGIWLTLAAMILLFFAGCFYGFGRCCISRRPNRDREAGGVGGLRNDPYAEQLRLDAVKAEADRKARQGEMGLPVFQEYEQTQPLTKLDPEEYVEDGDQILPYRPQDYPNVGPGIGAGASGYGAPQPSGYAPAGYAQGAPGTRAVDDYYNAGTQQSNAYPPRRDASRRTMDSSYAPSSMSPTVPPLPPPTRTPSVPVPDANQYLSTGAYGHNQYASAASQNYGHTAGGSTYHSAASHQQYPSAYSTNQYADPYSSGQAAPTLNPDTYNKAGYMAGAASFPDHSAYQQPTQPTYDHTAYQQQPQPDRSYTLGGDNYGTHANADYNSHPDQYSAVYSSPTSTMPPHQIPSPAPLNTNVAGAAHPLSPSSPRGPRGPAQPEQPVYEDSPPMYDATPSQPPGQWGAKH